MKTINEIVILTEGFVALCLGSADRIVWVHQSDAAAFSDDGKIYLPYPCGVDGEMELLLGIALREVAKIKHSEEGVLLPLEPDLRGYATAIEEARIKQQIGQVYRGAVSVFDAATEVIRKVTLEKVADESCTPEMVKHMAIWACANDSYLATNTSQMAAQDFVSMAEKSMDARKLMQAAGLAQAAPWLQSTGAAAMCASRIQALLADEPPDAVDEPQPQPQPQDAESASQDSSIKDEEGHGDSANESQDGVDEKAADAQSTSTSEGNGDSSTDSAEPPGAPPVEAQMQNSGTEPQGGDRSEKMACTDAMSNSLAMLKGHSGAKLADLANAQLHTSGDTPPGNELLSSLQEAMFAENAIEQMMALVTGDHGSNESTDVEPDSDDAMALNLALAGVGAGEEKASSENLGSNNLDPLPARLVSVLLREFQDKRPKTQFRSESGRDLSVVHLWRLKAVGDTRVFRKRAISSGIDAAVWILLDRSSSMKNDIELAANATNAFAQALQRISGVQTAISLFPGTDGVVDDVLKFRQSTIHSAATLKSVTASGGTPTGHAIREILPKLLHVPVQKRIIVLITDGIPSTASRTEEALAEAQSSGVDVIGVGIGQHAQIQRLIRRSVQIAEVSELPCGLEKLFRNELNGSLLAA